MGEGVTPALTAYLLACEGLGMVPSTAGFLHLLFHFHSLTPILGHLQLIELWESVTFSLCQQLTALLQC